MSTALRPDSATLIAPFPRHGGTLYAEGVPLAAIAAAVGTPCYVYAANTIRARFQQLAAAFQHVPHQIHFAMKANPSLAVLRLLRDSGAGVDIVSGGELFRARAAGFRGDDIVFSGVGKSAQELDQALHSELLLINVESEAELVALDAVAAACGRVARIAIRVNPEVTVATPHDYIKTGEKGQKFGIPRDDVGRISALAASLRHVSLQGVGMHLGSQIANGDPMRAALPRLLDAVRQLRTDGHTLRYLDVGGGLAVPYAASDPTADVDEYAGLIIAAVRECGLRLLLEPGRFLVAEAGVLLTRVLYRKLAVGKHFIVTDAGMNDLVRPALYQAFHDIESVGSANATITADVVGPICESGDFFAKDRQVADVHADDLLVVRTAGAYGFAMASNYNSRLRAAEVLVDGDRFAIVTERESLDDLMRLEHPNPDWRRA